MDLYEEKLYEFLSCPDNLDCAWEMYEVIPKLRDKLKADALNVFWKLATSEAQNKQWICWRIDPGEKIGVGKPAWKELFAVDLYLGRQYPQSFGLWHAKDNPGLKDRYEELVARTKEVARACGLKTKGADDLWYLSVGTNFETVAELRDLLPANRESLIRGYWQRLWNMAETFEPVVDEIVRSLGASSQ